MLKSSTRSMLSRVVLALMLFAQGAMAWSACALPERAPQLALRAAVEHQGCEQMAEQSPASSAVCFTHTLADKQSLSKASLDLPAILIAPALATQLTDDSRRDHCSPHSLCLTAGTGPPRRILLQSFQI